jgi:guanylate kinase
MTCKLLGNLKRGLAFIVSAPAGTGKTTLVKKLTVEFPCVTTSISFTTRQPRINEIDGIDYHFVTTEVFEKKIKENDFLEYVQLFGNYYGTCRNFVRDQQSLGKHVVLVIDVQGALKLKGFFDATFIFIAPPSLQVLRERLIARKTESSVVVEERLTWAKKELNAAKHYDYKVINDDLETAYQVLKSICIAEEHRALPTPLT